MKIEESIITTDLKSEIFRSVKLKAIIIKMKA
jgi:hypothetical protein